jgi:hypothetical protein
MSVLSNLMKRMRYLGRRTRKIGRNTARVARKIYKPVTNLFMGKTRKCKNRKNRSTRGRR